MNHYGWKYDVYDFHNARLHGWDMSRSSWMLQDWKFLGHFFGGAGFVFFNRTVFFQQMQAFFPTLRALSPGQPHFSLFSGLALRSGRGERCLDPSCRELPMPSYLLQVFVAKLHMGSLMVVGCRGHSQQAANHCRGSGIAARADLFHHKCILQRAIFLIFGCQDGRGAGMVLLELWETKRLSPTKQSGTHVTLPCVVAGQRPFLFCGLHANAVQVFVLGPTMKKFEEGDMLFWNLDTAGTLHLAPCLRERGL